MPLVAVGGLLLAVCIAAGFTDKSEFYRSYLVAFLFWLGITLGCLAVLMVQHLDRRAMGAGHPANSRSRQPHASLDGRSPRFRCCSA